ncbi:MAG: hypothetical protein ACFFDJ_09030 [Candidatus Odinarchaeota archaeon]
MTRNCVKRIILAYPDDSKEEKPWAWFQQKRRGARDQAKVW